jgi:hypothetical protein
MYNKNPILTSLGNGSCGGRDTASPPTVSRPRAGSTPLKICNSKRCRGGTGQQTSVSLPLLIVSVRKGWPHSNGRQKTQCIALGCTPLASRKRLAAQIQGNFPNVQNPDPLHICAPQHVRCILRLAKQQLSGVCEHWLRFVQEAKC